MDLSREKEIVEQAKLDPSAFGPLFDEYYQPILGYVMKRVGSVAAAQDITGEVFYKALLNISRFTWRNMSIRSWLYRIASNEIQTYFRKARYTPVSLDMLVEEKGFEPVGSTNLAAELVIAEDCLERQSKYQEVFTAMLALPLHYQEVLTLRFAEDMKISQIAQVMGKREGTIKSLISRGLEKLRKTTLQPTAESNVTDTEQPLLIIQPQESYED